MKDVDDFFAARNTVRSVSFQEQRQLLNYIDAIEAVARTTYKSIYVIDYKDKTFDFVSENPLFLCGHTSEDVRKMGYSFYFNHVPSSDLELLLKINTAGFDFYDRIPREERIKHSISYDFRLTNQEEKTFLINQKLTPLYLTEEGKIWKAICIVSLSNEQNSGNIKIYKSGENVFYKYDLEKNFWKKESKLGLTNREKEIISYSIRGFTINEMAEEMHVSSDTVKFHRKKMFEKLEVSNISEAIGYATNNKLL